MSAMKKYRLFFILSFLMCLTASICSAGKFRPQIGRLDFFVDDGASITLDLDNFDDILSSADTNVQLALDTLDDGAVNVAGDTMTGDLRISKANPQLELHDPVVSTVTSRIIYSATGGVTKIQALTYTPAGLGNALDFGGVDEWVDIGSTVMAQSTTSTISIWHEFTTGNWRAVISFDSTSKHVLQISTAGQIFYGNLASGQPSVGTASGAIVSGVVSHIVVLLNGTDITNAKIYVNNVDKTTSFVGAAIPYSPLWTNGRVGFRVDGLYPIIGKAVDLGIWNRSLSVTEIAYLYNSGSGRYIEQSASLGVGLELNYQFNQSTGTNVPDISGNGYNGTTQNMEDADWVLGFMLLPGSDNMINVISAEDGIDALQGYRLFIGDSTYPGELRLFGDEIFFQLDGSPVAYFDRDTKTFIIDTGETTNQQLILRAAAGASVPTIESQDALENTQNSWSPDGGGVINEEGNDVDWRVEGVGQPNALFVQGSDGFVGVGTNAPLRQWHLIGTGNSTVALIESSDFSSVFLNFKNTTSGTGFITYEGRSLNLYANNLKGLSLDLNSNITQGSGAAGVDYSYTVDGETNDGIWMWMEDEDYNVSFDDWLFSTSEKQYFRDTAIGIWSQADSFLDLFADGSVRIGNSSAGAPTNYTNIASTGRQTMVGTARVEKIIETGGNLGRGVSAPTVRTTEAPYISYTYAVSDDSQFTFEVPYDMDDASDFTIKAHWYTSVSQTDDEVQWRFGWIAAAEAGGEAVNTGPTNVDSGDFNCPIQWEIEETTIGTIGAANVTQGDMMGIDLERIAIVDGTDPALNTIHLLTIEIEYICNSLGGTF